MMVLFHKYVVCTKLDIYVFITCVWISLFTFRCYGFYISKFVIGSRSIPYKRLCFQCMSY